MTQTLVELWPIISALAILAAGLISFRSEVLLRLKFLEEIENVNKQNSVDFYNLMIPYAQSALANKLSKYGFKSEAICVRKEIT